MQRIPLKLDEPASTWDRTLPDYVMFERALNQDNVEDVDRWSEYIESETDTYLEELEDYLQATYNPYTSTDADIKILSKVILRASKYSDLRSLALNARAYFFTSSDQYADSINDFESILDSNLRDADKESDINGRLAMTHSLLRQFDKMKDYYERYSKQKHWKDTRPSSSNYISTDRVINDLYKKHKDEHSAPDIITEPLKLPYIFKKTSFADGCRVLAPFDLPANEIVFVEKPMHITFGMPWIQCEACRKLTYHPCVCPECKLKTYCSHKCRRRDIMHEDECIGYKYPFFLMLNAQQLVNLLIEMMYHIKFSIFNYEEPKSFENAEAALKVIRSEAKDKNTPMLQLLSEPINYDQLAPMHFSTILTTAVRLAIFIRHKTNILAHFSNIILSPKQELILVGCLLLQLQYIQHKHTLLFTFPTKYQVPNMFDREKDNPEDDSEEMKPTQKDGANDVFEFYNFSEEAIGALVTEIIKNGINITKNTEQTPFVIPSGHPKVIITPMQEFCDKIIKEVLENEYVDNIDEQDISRHIAQMSFDAREDLIISFIHEFRLQLFDYFENKLLERKNNPINQVAAILQNDALQFRHSCLANIELICLKDGTLIGKTLRTISANEECFIAYRSCHSRDEYTFRKSLLDRCGITCQCECCEFPDGCQRSGRTSNIYCLPPCKTEFGPSQKQCPKCDSDYGSLWNLYDGTITTLRDTISKMKDDKQTNFKWIVLIRALNVFFPEYNETRVGHVVSYLDFISKNNFVHQTYQLAKSTYICVTQYFPPDKTYKYCDKIMESLKTLLYFNIYSSLAPMPTVQIYEINSLCRVIIQVLLSYLDFYEKTSGNCGLLRDYLWESAVWAEKIQKRHFNKYRAEIKLEELQEDMPGLESKED